MMWHENDRRCRRIVNYTISFTNFSASKWFQNRGRGANAINKSVSLGEIREKDYVLMPGRYVGLPEDEDDFDFAERFGKLN
jgi:type I restriction enzyme M protein